LAPDNIEHKQTGCEQRDGDMKIGSFLGLQDGRTAKIQRPAGAAN
jgi:hypothetical protein